MPAIPLIFAYLSPDNLLPVTSCVAGVAGVVLMFGRNSARHFVRCGRRFLYRKGPIAATNRLHVARKSRGFEAARRRAEGVASAGGRTIGT